MRILIVNYEYPPLGGGGGIATHDLATELARRHIVHVLTTWVPGLARRETRRGVVIHRVPVWGRTDLPTATLRSMTTFVPAAVASGLRVLRAVRPDVVSAHFAVPSGIPAAVLARAARRPFVLTLIGGDVYDPSKGTSPHRHAALRRVVASVIRRATALVAISRDTRERAVQYYRAPRSMEIIPLGLVPPSYRSATRAELGWTPDAVHVVSIGRLIPRKGYHDLLRGFARTTHGRSELHVIGDGPMKEELARESERLGIARRVHIHGWVSDERKFQYLENADAYVSASHHEGFGICFLEAMYVGLPIIATDTGGQTDFLVAGRNAILIPPQREEQIAHAMDWIARDDALKSRMADTNTRDVRRYLIGTTARRYEDLFTRILRERSSSGHGADCD